MSTRITSGLRTARARMLVAQRSALNAMITYIDRMAPVWSDAQLLQAMTHLGRQRRMISSALHDHESIANTLNSSWPPSTPHLGEVGRSKINVMDLYGLPRDAISRQEVSQIVEYELRN